MKLVPFFDQEIRIKPHTATWADRIEKPVSIAKFAGERTVRLYQRSNGDLLCQALVRPYRDVAEFIEGPEVS